MRLQEIGFAIRRARQARQLTQADLAGSAGIGASDQGPLEYWFSQIQNGMVQNPILKASCMDKPPFRIVDMECTVAAIGRGPGQNVPSQSFDTCIETAEKSGYIRPVPLAFGGFAGSFGQIGVGCDVS